MCTPLIMHGELDMERLSYTVPRLKYLHDAGMHEAIRRGGIVVSPLRDAAVQPASLDVSVGTVRIYDAASHDRLLTAQKRHLFSLGDDLLLARYATRLPLVGGDAITLPQKTYIEIFLDERVSWDDSFDVQVTLRSSRARLGLRLENARLMQGDTLQGEEQPGEDGWYVGLRNFNVNPIVLHRGTPFAQLFFRPRTQAWDTYAGNVVTDPEAVARIAETLSPNLETHGPYVLFRAGERSWTYRRSGAIDTAGKTPADAIEEHDKEPATLGMFESGIVTLDPEIRVPANIGIRLLSTLPYAQTPFLTRPDATLAGLESMVVNGEWVDPGYNGHVTAHPVPYNSPRTIIPGMPFCVGLLIEYPSAAQRAYGDSALGSHYQGSKGDVARS